MGFSVSCLENTGLVWWWRDLQHSTNSTGDDDGWPLAVPVNFRQHPSSSPLLGTYDTVDLRFEGIAGLGWLPKTSSCQIKWQYFRARLAVNYVLEGKGSLEEGLVSRT